MNNIRTNAVMNQTTQFKILDETQCNEIFEAALRILERTGCEVMNNEALVILKNAGAKVHGSRVWIKPYLVEKALQLVPKQVTIYNTEGNPQMHVSARNGKTYFTNCLGATNIVDRHTNINRAGVYNDAYEAGLVTDALPNFDMVSGMCFISDRNPILAEVYETRALLESSTKPQFLYQTDKMVLQAQLDMFAAVVGGMDKYQAKPCGLMVLSATPPLCHTDGTLEKAISIWKAGIPAYYCTGIMIGATAPVTIAGSLVAGLADILVGLVISQEVNPGTPFLTGLGMTPFDMARMSYASRSPETMVGGAAAAELFQYLNLPYKANYGSTDSPIFDHQAAGDMSQLIMLAAISGGSLYNHVGYLGSVNSSSIESLVYCNEVMDMVRRFMQGMEVNAETLAEDVINSVGPKGDYIGEAHTAAHFRETWMPKDFVRMNHQIWEAEGKKDLRSRCIEKVDSIVAAGPRKPRDQKLLQELDNIVKAYEDRI